MIKSLLAPQVTSTRRLLLVSPLSLLPHVRRLLLVTPITRMLGVSEIVGTFGPSNDDFLVFPSSTPEPQPTVLRLEPSSEKKLARATLRSVGRYV